LRDHFDRIENSLPRRSTRDRLASSAWKATSIPSAACTTALIDRVVHHADIIAIEGESYRKREAQAAIARGKSGRKVKT